jgi:hypothetical protein
MILAYVAYGILVLRAKYKLENRHEPDPAPLTSRSDFGSVSQVVDETLTLNLWKNM